MHRFALIAAVTLGLSSLASAAPLQFQKPEDAIKYRQAAFTLIAAHFGRVANMAQGRIPFDAQDAAASAALASTLSALPFSAFGPGTDQGAPTRTKPEALTSAEFKAGGEKMQSALASLATVAQGGDVDAIRRAVGEAGRTCKGCHDEYRNEKYSN